MAFQGKGIFGNPKGKVGDLMFYERNGKAIVQRCPTLSKDVKPQNRFFSPLLIGHLPVLYNKLWFTWDSYWRNYPDFNIDGYENYFNFNSSIIEDLKLVNYNNLWCHPPINLNVQDIFANTDFSSKVFHISVKNGGFHEVHGYPTEARIAGIRSTNNLVLFKRWVRPNGIDKFSLSYTGLNLAVWDLIVFQLRYSGNINWAQGIQLDYVKKRV